MQKSIIMAALAVVLLASPAWAQEGGKSNNEIVQVLRSLNTGTIAVILIFGTCLVTAIFGGVAQLMKAYRGGPNTRELQEQLDDLEDRIVVLERRSSHPGLADTQTPQPGHLRS